MEGPLHKHVTRAELDVLMAHLIRCDDVMGGAFGRLSRDDFDQSESSQRIIWILASNFWEKHKKLPPKEIMEVMIDRALLEHPEYNAEHMRDSVFGLLDMIFSWPNLMPGYALDILQSFLWQRQIAPKIMEVANSGYVQEHIWESIKEHEGRVRINRTSESRPFDEVSGLFLGIPKRDSTYLVWLNGILNGGTRPGDLIGFLAPTGGGKTTLTHQLGISHARNHKHVVIFSYEQGVDNEYFVPVYACAAHIHRDKIEAIRKAEDANTILTPDELARFRRSVSEIGQHLHYIDMSGSKVSCAGDGGVMEIDLKLTEMERQKGIKISMFAVDWFWPLVTRSYANIQIGKGKRVDIRIHAQAIIDELKAVTSKHNCWCWLPHQLNPDKAKQNRPMTFVDAAELHSFAWYMTGCLCFGQMDVNKIGILNFAKARNQATSQITLQLEGEYATFKETGSLRYDARQKVYIPPENINKVPSEKVEEAVTSALRTDYEGVGAQVTQ